MEAGRINKFFHTDEFKCKCGCGIVNLDPDFLNLLTATRRIADVPFVINSGCRCPQHNLAVGGTTTSAHITTEVIRARGSDIRAATLEMVIAILFGAFTVGIPGIALGVGKESKVPFVHLDTKNRKMFKVNVAFTLTKAGLFLG